MNNVTDEEQQEWPQSHSTQTQAQEDQEQRKPKTEVRAAQSPPFEVYLRLRSFPDKPFHGSRKRVHSELSPLMTRKVRTFAKGVMNTGTLGFGFVLLSPERMAANDTAPVYFSDATYAGSTVNTPPAVGVVIGASNSDYVLAQFGTTATLAQFRVVSSGLRVRYVGTNLNRGGQMIALQEPTHDDLLGYSLTALDAQDQSVRFKVNEKWTYLTYRPVFDSETLFSADPVLGGVRARYLVIAVQAPTGVSGAFEWEAFTNFEFTGQSVDVIETREKTFLQEVETYASQGLTWLVQNAGAAAAGLIAML